LSWAASINDARDEIADIQEETPSLNDSAIKEMWDKAFVIAKRDAQAEMQKKSTITSLSWQQVFENDYDLPDSNSI